jgi:hypothetical protein
MLNDNATPFKSLSRVLAAGSGTGVFRNAAILQGAGPAIEDDKDEGANLPPRLKVCFLYACVVA